MSCSVVASLGVLAEATLMVMLSSACLNAANA